MYDTNPAVPEAQATTPAKDEARKPWYRRGRPLACIGGAALLVGAFVVGIPVGAAYAANSASTTETTAAPGTTFPGGGNTPGGGTQTLPGEATTTTTSEATEADADESTGVVIIETELGYDGSAAAGTGLVLTEDGLILTNYHVIDDSTEISVTIASTGETYTATVVGSNAEEDVAVLQLEGASNLETVTIDDDEEEVGDTVTAVGNSNGEGVLMAADGEITELESSVTTSSTGTTEGETLDGMIEFTADVVSGDSGGALLDDEGEVIGVTTAASSGTATTVAYAIPIEDAMDIVEQVLAGDESDGVTIGYPAFLGVQIAEESTTTTTTPGSQGFGTPGSSGGYTSGGSPTDGSEDSADETTGATIAGVIDGTPAAEAGLAAGDVITAVDGVSVADADALSELLAGYDPGDSVTITWTDSSGATQSTTVTLIEGPA